MQRRDQRTGNGPATGTAVRDEPFQHQLDAAEIPELRAHIVEFPLRPHPGFVALLHLAVTTAKLHDPGGVRAVIAENLLLKQQLIVLRRPRQRAPNLTVSDRLLCGFAPLFLSPGRIRKVAIGVRPATLLRFHQVLVRRKYHRLFSASPRPRQPGPKGPSEALIQAIVELKMRNPRFGCPRMARIISLTFGIDIDKNVVYRVSKHVRPAPSGTGPSWLSFIGRHDRFAES